MRSILNGQAERTWFRYDSAGNRTHVSDKSNPADATSLSATETEYDALNRRVKETITADGLNAAGLPDGTVALRKLSRTWTYHGPTTEYRDRDNRLLTSLIEVNVAPVGPNLRRLTQTSVYTEFDAAGTSRNWNYSTATSLNAAGDAISSNETLLRDGGVYYGSDIGHQFDLLGRITTTTQLNKFLTDQSGHRWQYSWHANGVRKDATLGVDQDASNAAVVFDNLWTTSYATDHRGMIRGASRTYTTDTAAQIFWRMGLLTPENKSVKYEYLADGNRDTMERYTAAGYAPTPFDGVTAYDYSGSGQSLGIIHRQGWTEPLIATYGLQYDNAGRVTRRHVQQFAEVAGSTEQLVNSLRDFIYDADGELKSVKETLTVGGSTTTGTTSYDTDHNGNRRSGDNTIIGKANRLYHDDLYNYRYDNEGRLTEKTSHQTLSFDNPENADDPSYSFRKVKGAWTTEPGRYRRTGTAAPDQFVSYDSSAEVTAIFATVRPGTYDVWATWLSPVQGAVNAGGYGRFSVSQNGGTLLSTDFVNFANAPSTDLAGILWQPLGTIVVTSNGAVQVSLQHDTDVSKAIAFDGVRLTAHESVVNYGWDVAGRLLEVRAEDAGGAVVTDVLYGYDAAGRKSFRRDAVAGTSDLVYTHDGLNTVLERQSSGTFSNPPVAFFYGAGVNELVAVDLEVDGPGVTSAIGTTWSFADLQGTVRSFGWYDDDGDEWQLVHRNSGEFGEESLLSLGAINFPFLRNAPSYWAGHQKDATTGLTDMKARWYNESSGRFLSEDPLGFDSGDTNLYRYTFNSPGNFVDPDGRIVESIWDLASPGIGVASFGYNLFFGTWTDVGIDVAGIVGDTAALFLPGVPGGAGISIKASRAARYAAKAVQATNASRVIIKGSQIVGASRNLQYGVYGLRAAGYGANIYQSASSVGRAFSAYQNDDWFGASVNLVGAGLGFAGTGSTAIGDLTRVRNLNVAKRLEQMTSARFAEGINPKVDGPAIAVAYDRVTGEYSRVWLNAVDQENAPVLIGAVRRRVGTLNGRFGTAQSRIAPEIGFHFSDPSIVHAEVSAVNELLWKRLGKNLNVDDLSGIVTRVISTKSVRVRGTVYEAGSLFQFCQNCSSILHEVWSIAGRRRAVAQLPWES